MRHRVENGELVVRDVHAVDRSVGVHGRVALVGRDLVVDVVDLGAPFPHRGDDVALDTLRTGWPGWKRTRRDPVAPVGEHLKAALAAEAVHDGAHLPATLPHLDPVIPGGKRRIELVDVLDLADDLGAELVAQHATLLLDVHPLALVLEALGDPVAARPGPGEFARIRRLDQ